ncbi:YlxR family protein [Actinomyces bovis]|uniref:YlxR family protein n=1 Tax=Actinomyces bovis TaxID=1658 RepID=UPI001E306E4B|nr:YlxR family protein [Actinomyces bovis]
MTATSHVPERTCIGCRSRAPRAQLLRLTVADGTVTVDERACTPGRGAWIHRDSACLDLAERRRAFGRALRVEGPLDLGSVHQWFSRFLAAGPAVAPTGDGTTDCKGG